MSIHGAVSQDAPKYDNDAHHYDAILVMSFGGPEGKDEVMPFLENVATGRNIPRERLEEVAHHYYDFGGVSPINQQNRELITALESDLKAHDISLPIYFGNRNWHPLIEDTMRQMRDDGVKRALVFVTSAFSCYSGCRQYREDIIRAAEQVDNAPEFDKIRVFYNHPGFIGAVVDETEKALAQFDNTERDQVHLAFTAHSIPMGMAKGSDYEQQLEEACRIVAEKVGTDNYKLVYQSRSGPPQIPWLEPDICDYLETIHQQGTDKVVIVPIGFISDHMEVIFDLDTEAMELADEIGMKLVRAGTAGTHPQFIAAIRDLVVERMTANPERAAIGQYPANHDICPLGCCDKGASRPAHHGKH